MGSAKKLIRSGLLRFPRLYEAVASRRYLLGYRLGIVYEPGFRALPALLASDALVLDVGANSGQSVLSIKRVLPRARIISFEPNPCHAHALIGLTDRFSDLSYEPVGLADENGESYLYVPVYNGKAMSGLASFDYAKAAGWLSPKTVFGFDPARLEIRQVKTRLQKLDDYDLNPDLIKIDVQGFEEQVIRGGMETIKRSRPVLFVESSAPAVLDSMLCPLGYEAFRKDHGNILYSPGENTPAPRPGST
jgi:FkbM family methyltransferase